MTNEQLRQKLIEMVKEQNKPFGLLIDDIAGGFTFTGRAQPQAFQVLPLVVYKVYPDGRPDQLGARSGHRGHAAGLADENRGHRRHAGYFQRLLRRGIRLGAGVRRCTRNFDFGDGSAEEGNFHRQAADSAAARARSRTEGATTVRKFRVLRLFGAGLFAAGLLGIFAPPFRRHDSGAGPKSIVSIASAALAQAPVPETESDKTLHAMHDEMERSRKRLQLPGVEKPFYLEYRLLDLDVRTVTSSFGALMASSTTRNRFMSVDVRVGDYHLDSSNFVSEDGFQGFLGSTGEVGIDRDYNSLRQDLWLATDQAYKQAVTQMSLKQSFLRSLSKPPEIDDFAQAPPLVKIDPRVEPEWTSRNWEDESRAASAALLNFPQLNGTRVNYYLVYVTYYLMNTRRHHRSGSRAVLPRSKRLSTPLLDDGMALHDFYSVYVAKPADLPDPATVGKALGQTGTELMTLRQSPLVPDFTGPVLFDAPAAGSVLAQTLASSLSGARPPLSTMPAFDEIMERMGGRSEWTGRVGHARASGQRVAGG